MTTSTSLRLAVAAAILAGSGVAQAADIATTPIAGTRLDVTAEGEVARAPDLATITAGVVVEGGGAGGTMAEVARRIAAATAALRKAGIADRDIRTASLSLQPQYRYAEGQAPVITGYRASNQLTVRFHDISRAGAILDALVGQGINQISGPDFSVEQPEAALDEARTRAIAAARARADLYAKATGQRVVRIVAISEGGGWSPPQAPRPMMIMARADKVATDLAPGEEKLGVSLNVVFELQ